ncbi:C2H2-type zinc finger protein [Nitrosopumilus sp.]|uniref:C2H2-type zinc finger protein n=1 Tax=Nitrosopumilus sp. TaxID=2024843 RepID=UPI0026085B93|nr:C2H2-type zinc finger protein [Nitrosopumilus sp.]
MLTVDCKDVLAIQNELLVYVSDQVAAIPTLKNHQFTLSTLDDDEIIDTSVVISSIKEFLDSIGEGHNFAVISKNEVIAIQSISGKIIEREPAPPQGMFSCTHCGFVTQYQVELDVHMKIHYL